MNPMVSLPSSKDSKPATGLGDPFYVDKARRINQKMCPRKLRSHELNGWGVRESVFRLFRLICNVYDIHMYIYIYTHIIPHLNCKILIGNQPTIPTYCFESLYDFVKII